MKRLIIALSFVFLSFGVMAKSLTVTLYRVAEKGHGTAIGTVEFQNAYGGLLITPKLHGLSPGLHGFHIHQLPNCQQMGMASGGHYDPMHTGKHLGPYDGDGHLGDMPALFANKKGQVMHPVFAPRLRMHDLYGHALVVHQGGDNYSDTPAKLGGGRKRIACAVILPVVKNGK